MPPHRTFGRRGVGNAPTPATESGNAGSVAAAFDTTRHTFIRSRSSTSPRNSRVTCRFASAVHFTPAPLRAKLACTSPAARRTSGPTSTPMNVRVRAM